MKIRVIPNARQFSLTEKNNAITVRIQAKPQDNEANKELCKKLGELVGAKVVVAKGPKSREKEIVFQGITEEEARRKIKENMK